MLKITALFTTLALGATASIAMASPVRVYDRRSGAEYAPGGVERSRIAGSRVHRPLPGNGVGRARIDHAQDRIARLDSFDRWRGGRAVDDFGPRRYRPTWVALGAPHRLGDSECIEVRDPGTFTQLRLQSNSGVADIDRVIVQFADGTDQVAEFDRALDQRGEFVELPLDGNNQRVDKIIVTGALGDLQVFAIRASAARHCHRLPAEHGASFSGELFLRHHAQIGDPGIADPRRGETSPASRQGRRPEAGQAACRHLARAGRRVGAAAHICRHQQIRETSSARDLRRPPRTRSRAAHGRCRKETANTSSTTTGTHGSTRGQTASRGQRGSRTAVMRWMQPPQIDGPPLDRFDPVREGARHRLSPEQSLALWKRVCAEASDDAGRSDDEHARRRFRELAAQGGRLGAEVGKRTRVEADAGHGAGSTDEARPAAPGRDSLVAAEARRQRSASAPAMSDAREQPLPTASGMGNASRQLPLSAPAMSDAREQPSWSAAVMADARQQPPQSAAEMSAAREQASLNAPVETNAGWRPPLATPVTAVAPWQPSQSMRLAAAALQMRQAARAVGLDEARRRELAAAGLSGPGGPLPHRDRIQRSFGRHDVSAVRAHVDGNAAQASEQIGARAYASDGQVAFRGAPDLHLAAHEAAHVVQQRTGVQLSTGVGAAGDVYERQADAVADVVVAGGSAEGLLDQHAGGTAPAGDAIQLTQDPDAQRQSRISVATSVQAYRVTYPDTRRGGLLTQALLTQLRDRRASVANAVARTGDGTRQFGAQPASGEERAGTSLGASAAPPTGTAAQRRAVVIGNGTYNPGTHMGSTVEPTRPLPNSPSDAAAIATALRTRGYNVVSLTNQTAAQINEALRAQLAGLGAGSEVVFFYSGHGTPEGLIGSDGQAFTPAQALALRNQARQAQVDLTFATDACHAGVFADAVRGAELTDTRAAAQRGAAAGASSGPVVALLDAAIALQSAKDRYNTTMQQWWARRYELEVPINAGNTSDPVMDAWTAHYNLGATHWNTFIVPANAALVTLHTTATTASHTLRPLTLTALGTTYDNTGEMAVQAGLDDVDTLTNEVLTFANSRLPA